MRVRPLALAVLVTATAAAFASSIDALDPPPSAAAAAPTAWATGGITIDTGVPVPGRSRADPWPPASALDAFRGFEGPCSEHAALAGRNTDDHPRVEPDRFAGAGVVRDLAPGTTLVEDGYGTPLVVTGGEGGWTLLAASGRPDDPLPDPSRLGCPEQPVLQEPQTPQPAPGN